jgi:DMSO/TMAO reductase YedYZ molybdopterin-dependent catalytic subunit
MKQPDRVKAVPDQDAGSRVPPGQFLSKRFPVLTYGPIPKITIAEWRLRVFGLAGREVELDWEQFSNLQWQAITADFHCVTQWSSLDNNWEGVSFANVVALARPLPSARFVMVHCHGGYSTNLPMDLAMTEGWFAHKHNGQPLEESHGWPLRLIVPSRYAWKSAKWVSGIELLAEDAPGFWERRGYNNRGDPWKEERFSSDLTP